VSLSTPDLLLMRLLVGLLLFAVIPPLAAVQQAPGAPAESLFVAGRFEEAQEAFLARWAVDSTDYRAALRLGTIGLYGNRLGDAERWLSRALALAPDSARPKTLLAEARYRGNDFGGAVTMLRATNATLRASKLESFSGRTPYEIAGAVDVVRIPFVQTDPLPIVAGGINGVDTLFFLIDTGGGEVLVDTALGRALGAVTFGQRTGVFAGGTAPVTEARVDSVRLGGFTVRNVPVGLLDMTRIGAAVGHRVDGIIGTILLYHFLPTLDYPKGELVLRRRTPEMRAQFEREAAAQNTVAQPFWLAGDHFMFAWGQVNGRPPVLLFVDTGLAGGGFVCSEQAARDYGIDLSKTQTAEGVGGAGPTRVTWFTVDSLSMGPVTGRNIRGALGTLLFRASFGFDAGGIISHQFFRPYALTFDFDAMRLYLTPGTR